MIMGTDRDTRHRVVRSRVVRGATAVLLAVATATATGMAAVSPAEAASWSGWKSLGKSPSYAGFPLLAATSRPTGETDLFAVSGTADLVYHRWRRTGDWSAFGSLGRPDTGYGISSVAAAARPTGQLYVFVSTYHGEVWRRTWTASTGWKPWGKVSQQPADFVKSVSASVRHDGTIDLIGLGTDGNVYHRWQAMDGDTFSPWGSLGKPSGGIWLTPVVASGAGVDIIASSNADNRVYRRSWRESSGWAGWAVHTAPYGGFVTDEVAASWKRSGNTLDIFAVNDNHLHRKTWTSSDGWSGWEDLYYPGSSEYLDAPTATWGYTGRLDVFVQDPDSGTVYWRSRQ